MVRDGALTVTHPGGGTAVYRGADRRLLAQLAGGHVAAALDSTTPTATPAAPDRPRRGWAAAIRHAFPVAALFGRRGWAIAVPLVLVVLPLIVHVTGLRFGAGR